MSIRTAIASFALTAVVATAAVASASPAGAAVATPSGARADTVLVCMRTQGAYAVGTQSSGFHYLRMYNFNAYTGSGSWSNWMAPSQIANSGFGLPTRGQLAVYVQYAHWNGRSWELAGEWGKVLNARGEHVSWYC